MARKNVVLSFRLKDDGGVLNYDGALAKGLELLFTRLPDALARRKMLHQLEQDHARLLRLEDGASLDADQQTAAQVAALGHQVHPAMAMPSLTPDGHAARLAIQPAPAAAWMTEDGERVVPAKTMEGARRDGGAMLSTMKPYTVALVRADADPEDKA